MCAEKGCGKVTNLPEASFVLLYPDLTRVVNVPGSDKIFSVVGYKAFLGKAYQQVLLFVVNQEDYDEVSWIHVSYNFTHQIVTCIAYEAPNLQCI